MNKKGSPMADKHLDFKKLSFEDAYNQLESIVEKLENEQISLEESLQFFEQGEALSKHCSLLLDTAEQRLRRLQPGFSTLKKEDED